MISNDRTITAWQAGIMVFILMFANKVLALPSLLYDKAKLEAFIIPVVVFALEFGLIFIFYKLKTKYPNQSFADICKKHFGKIVTYIVYILFLSFFLCKSVLLYNFTFIFFKNLIYKEGNNFVYLVCFIPVINHLAIMGLRVMGRTSQLFFPVIVGITLFCIIVGFFGVTNSPLMFESNINDIFHAGLQHISSFGDSIFLFLIMDKLVVKKGQWKVIFSLSAFAMALVTTVTVVFVFSYTYTSFMHPFALFEIMSYVKEYGGMGRIDIIAMVLIILFTYFHLAIYLKAFMLSFDTIFPTINRIYSVLTFDLVFIIFIEFLVLNLEKAVAYSEQVLPYFSIFAFFIVPVLSIVLIFIKKRHKKEGSG